MNKKLKQLSEHNLFVYVALANRTPRSFFYRVDAFKKDIGKDTFFISNDRFIDYKECWEAGIAKAMTYISKMK